LNSGHNIISRYLEARNSNDESSSERLWVLATLIARVGSSYRKEGAMMFVSPSGERIGVLSGGCLESDIVQQAYRVSYTGEAKIIEYDSLEDGYQIGPQNTGCLGKIEILLVPITEHTRLEIEQSHRQLQLGQSCIIHQALPTDALDFTQCDKPFFSEALPNKSPIAPSTIEMFNKQLYSVTTVKPQKKLLVIGAGHDAAPICQIAKQLGWYVHLWDERLGSEKTLRETSVDHLDNRKKVDIDDFTFIEEFDAVLLKSHNLEIDSFWLAQLETFHGDIQYMGLLGPKDRKQKVIELAMLDDESWSQDKVMSPAGLALGGDSPESIALSIISQAHQVLHSSS